MALSVFSEIFWLVALNNLFFENKTRKKPYFFARKKFSNKIKLMPIKPIPK